MYTQQQASAVRQKFWTAFGQYMAPVPSAAGEKINWVNYKTGVKGISFRMNADNNRAYVAIEIFSANPALQKQYFDLMMSLQKPFEKIAGKNFDYREFFITDTGKSIGSIRAELNNINIFRENQWPEIISFLKKNLMALDVFWNEYREVFEMMG